MTLLHDSGLSPDRRYLDNCSTVTAFANGKYLENIKKVTNGMKVNCNAGEMKTNEVGFMEN